MFQLMSGLFKLFDAAAKEVLPRTLMIGAIIFVIRFGNRIIAEGWDLSRAALPGDALISLLWAEWLLRSGPL